MSGNPNNIAITLFSEIIAVDQLARHMIDRVLPKGMELSHFSVLNHLAHAGNERSPAQLAKTFHVTRGAMTNTLRKLEWAGWVHIRPDWDDARRKMVGISPAGAAALQAALDAMGPLFADVVDKVGPEKVGSVLPVLRDIRYKLTQID